MSTLTDDQWKKKGFGRIGLRLKADTLDKLAELAKRLGLTRAEAVTQAIDEALERELK